MVGGRNSRKKEKKRSAIFAKPEWTGLRRGTSMCQDIKIFELRTKTIQGGGRGRAYEKAMESPASG